MLYLHRVTGTEKKEFGFKVEGEFNDLQDFIDDAKTLDRDDGTLLCRYPRNPMGIHSRDGGLKPFRLINPLQM